MDRIQSFDMNRARLARFRLRIGGSAYPQRVGTNEKRPTVAIQPNYLSEREGAVGTRNI